jgi:hypothetical protein
LIYIIDKNNKSHTFQLLASTTPLKDFQPGPMQAYFMSMNYKEIPESDLPLYVGWPWVHPMLADLIKGSWPWKSENII